MMAYQRILVAHLYLFLMSILFFISPNANEVVGFVFVPFVLLVYIYLLCAYCSVLHSVTFFIFFLHVYFFLRYLYIPISNATAYVHLAVMIYTFLVSVIFGWFALRSFFLFLNFDLNNCRKVEIFFSEKYVVNFWNLSIGLYAIVWLLMLYLSGFLTIDYVSMIFNSLEIRKTLGSGFLAYLGILSSFLFSSLIYSSLYLFLYFNKRFRLVLTIFFLLFFFLPLGSRGAIVLQLFSIFVITSTFKGKINWLYFVFFFVFAILFSVVYLSVREGGGGQVDSAQDVLVNILSRFDSFDNVMMIWNISNDELIYGRSVVDFLLQFIPRSLFLDKPYLFPSEMTRTYLPFVFDNGVTFDFSGLYEAYINFGAFGSVFFGIWVGSLLKINDIVRLWAFKQKSLFLSYLYSSFFMIPSFYFSIAWINSGVNISVIIIIIMAFVFHWVYVQKINALYFASSDKERKLP